MADRAASIRGGRPTETGRWPRMAIAGHHGIPHFEMPLSSRFSPADA